jgi:hypothetical protein
MLKVEDKPKDVLAPGVWHANLTCCPNFGLSRKWSIGTLVFSAAMVRLEELLLSLGMNCDEAGSSSNASSDLSPSGTSNVTRFCFEPLRAV